MLLRMLRAFQSQGFEFPSAYGLAESVARLKAATRRSVFSDMAHQAAVGRVSERRVRLQRSVPLVGNSFKPFFVGRFIERAGHVVLVGQFRMLWLVRVFLAVWFGVLTVGTVSWTVLREPHQWTAIGACLAMYAAGGALVYGGQWLSRKDAAYLSSVIRSALSGEGAPVGSIRPPRHERLCRWAAVQGGVLAVMAVGAWRRRLFAWRLGFLVFALMWIETLFQGLADQYLNVPLGIAAVVLIGSALVLGVWAWWWRAQRVHFEPAD